MCAGQFCACLRYILKRFTLEGLALCSNISDTRRQPSINRGHENKRTKHNLHSGEIYDSAALSVRVCVYLHTHLCPSCALKHRSHWFFQIGAGLPVGAACPLRAVRSLLGSFKPNDMSSRGPNLQQ